VSRLEERLDAVYAIGGGPGANRIGFSAEEDAAHELAAGWMREAGLEVEIDATGNLVGRLPGEDPALPEVWTGSHLDSVPQGGRYDGPLGVLAAIEALERLGPGRRTLAAVAFRDEERGCAGSRGLVASGRLPGVWVELHHEQGPRLALADAPLGIVTGIVGYKRGVRTYEGRAGHAGTTPMDGREDALVAAAEEILRLRDLAGSIDGAVATVGTIEVEPGGTNVIPSLARFSVDVRAPDAERLTRLIDEAGLPQEGRTEPAAMSPAVRDALRAEVEARGLRVVELASGAGHDAGILASAGVESGMLFVRALNGGVSHSPDELSSEEDVALAVDVLTAAVGRLAG
jgi:allantoate deiminase